MSRRASSSRRFNNTARMPPSAAKQPVERRAREVSRIGDLVGPELRVPKMRVDVIQRGLSPRLHVIRFIARQPCARAGGRQRHDALDRRLGFAHRQIVGLRIKLPHRCADQTRRAAPARKDEAVRLERQQCRGHALARKVNDQIRVVGRHTVERPRIID